MIDEDALRQNREYWESRGRTVEPRALATARLVVELDDLREMHRKAMNRRAEVEGLLLDIAAGKRLPPTPDECRAFALKLGVPDDPHFGRVPTS